MSTPVAEGIQLLQGNLKWVFGPPVPKRQQNKVKEYLLFVNIDRPLFFLTRVKKRFRKLDGHDVDQLSLWSQEMYKNILLYRNKQFQRNSLLIILKKTTHFLKGTRNGLQYTDSWIPDTQNNYSNIKY